MPTATEYNQAIQNLCVTAADEELKSGEPALNPLGLPLEYSGGFAVVYQVRCPKTGKTWALKCFTKEVDHRRERYESISQHLRRVQLPFMVGFEYQEQGLLVNGRWEPIVKMDWVEGDALNHFVAENLDKPGTLRQLLRLWVRLAQRLDAAEVTHGDLQHGNVLLVPPAREGEGPRLRLVDYDGMHVPALADRPSGELGHRAYQHPQRLRDEIYSAQVDRFSHLVIYCALHCLIAGGPDLWNRYNNHDNLLFRDEDFAAPGESKLFRELWKLPDPAVHVLAGRLLLATQMQLANVPRLDDLHHDGKLLGLSRDEEQQVGAMLLGAEAPGVRPPKVSVASMVPSPSQPVLCPCCHELTAAPEDWLPMPVTFDQAGNLSSPVCRIKYRRNSLFRRLSIEAESLGWRSSNPGSSLLRSAEEAAWMLVVQKLLTRGPTAEHLRFVAGLARAGANRWEDLQHPPGPGTSVSSLKMQQAVAKKRRPILQQCLILARRFASQARIPHASVAEHYRLLLADQFQTSDSGQETTTLLEQLLDDCLTRQLPLDCLDVALEDASWFDGLSADDQRWFVIRFCEKCVERGHNVGEIAALAEESTVISSLLARMSRSPAEAVAFLAMMPRVCPEGLVKLQGTTVTEFTSAQQLRCLAKWPDLLALADDGTVALRMSGFYFREVRYVSMPSLSVTQEKHEFRLNVGSRSFGFHRHPGELMGRLAAWCHLYFQKILPLVHEELFEELSPERLRDTRSVTMKCPHCQRIFQGVIS